MPFFDYYPYTNFHNVNLDWILQAVKAWGQLVEQNNIAFQNLQEANENFKTFVTNNINEFESYVTGYLENLDVQEEINNKLDAMFESGVLGEYLQPYVSPTVTTWLAQNITVPEGVIIDNSLTIDGACADAKAVGDKLKECIKSINTIVSPNNYSTILPTLNDTSLAGKCYTFISTRNMAVENGGLWADLPLEMKRSQCVGSLITLGAENTTGTTQILYLANIGKIYTRYYNRLGTTLYWTDWVDYNNINIIIDANGNGNFTSFTEGILFATQFNNAHVIVNDGIYDIIAEYQNKYGSNFFSSYTGASENVGVVLKNNVVVEFSPNAKIVCNYTGTNTNVQHKFSPLNSGEKGFTLINAVVESTNVRYSVHDERGSSTEFYRNTYKNCYFRHDKSNGAGYFQCIGGGLGKSGAIEIDGCRFESVTTTGTVVSWHNNIDSNSKSTIHIKNSVINGRVKFGWYGTSTDISMMYITACKMLSEPVAVQETTYDIENVAIMQWCNEIG